MGQVIIITDTEEPGAPYCDSSMAVIKLDTDVVSRMQMLATELKNTHSDFSELRLWGSYAEYYSVPHPECLLEELMEIPFEDPSKITTLEVEKLMEFYQNNGFFKWPSNIEFNLLELVSSIAGKYGGVSSNEPIEPMSVDIEEFVAESTDFRCAAYNDVQPVYTKSIPYSFVLNEVVI